MVFLLYMSKIKHGQLILYDVWYFYLYSVLVRDKHAHHIVSSWHDNLATNHPRYKQAGHAI